MTAPSQILDDYRQALDDSHADYRDQLREAYASKGADVSNADLDEMLEREARS